MRCGLRRKSGAGAPHSKWFALRGLLVGDAAVDDNSRCK